MLKLYNSLTKKVEEVPKKDHLNLYTCGPTVYNYAHIGNLRAFIMADLLYRTLKYEQYNPKWVMNITDIDDKTIKGTIAEYGANATVKDLYNFTEKYLQIFKDDLKEVNVLVDEIEMIRVTDKIKEIQDFIIALIDKGYAYKADDGIYFSIEKYQKDFGDYGVLVGEKFIEGKKVGARVAVDEYEKDNLSDFALWKAHNVETDGQIFWQHPVLGNGRPGWHIECSVINQVAFKGEPTDIHTGGVDLIFPHHTNEIAQSQALLGKGNFVKHWFHSEHLLVDSKKMAKSAGNFYTLADLRRKPFNKVVGSLPGMSLRRMALNAHYGKSLNFTQESYKASGWDLFNLATNLEPEIGVSNPSAVDIDNNYLEIFEKALSSDLNFSEVMAVMWKLAKDKKIFSEAKEKLLEKIDDVVGLKILDVGVYLTGVETWTNDNLLPKNILDLKEKRHQARSNQNFTESDELRKQIEALGYEVMDTPEGQKVKKKISI